MDNRKFSTTNERCFLRFAQPEDVPLIFEFIQDLAIHLDKFDEVLATEKLLKEWIFEKQIAEVLICEYEDEPVGFALFHNNVSTFAGGVGIFIEDLYVKVYMRGRGLGKMLLKQIAKLAIERNCGMLEWRCHNQNHGSISFYLSLGANQMSDWTTYRLSGETLASFAK